MCLISSGTLLGVGCICNSLFILKSAVIIPKALTDRDWQAGTGLSAAVAAAAQRFLPAVNSFSCRSCSLPVAPALPLQSQLTGFHLLSTSASQVALADSDGVPAMVNSTCIRCQLMPRSLAAIF